MSGVREFSITKNRVGHVNGLLTHGISYHVGNRESHCRRSRDLVTNISYLVVITRCKRIALLSVFLKQLYGFVNGFKYT